MKFAAFDLEIAKDLPENEKWQDASPLGITCAAVAFSDNAEPIFWKGVPKMTQLECQDMFARLKEIADSGYTFVTWNGCAFDFAVLAEESGLVKECGEFALQHVDLMLIVTFTKGWYLGLQKALLGAGLKGKRKSVTLSDGSILDEMGGIEAPKMWADGEYDAVLSYLKDDVVELINLVKVISKTKEIRWTSDKGKFTSVPVPYFPTVLECFDIPEPDVSWMTDPPTRKQFVEWMSSHSDLHTTKKITREEIIKMIYIAIKDYSILHLSGHDLSGLDLSRLNLSKDDLSSANLSGADLSSADLSGALLLYANLSDADLSGADLSGCEGLGANMSGANLIGANLIGANLPVVKLSGANLSGANLSGAHMLSTDLSGADLRGTILSGAFIRVADMSDGFLKYGMSDEDLRIARGLSADLFDAVVREAFPLHSDAKLVGAKYNLETRFPNGFDPKKAGAILEE